MLCPNFIRLRTGIIKYPNAMESVNPTAIAMSVVVSVMIFSPSIF